jgi:hypothetical protein
MRDQYTYYIQFQIAFLKKCINACRFLIAVSASIAYAVNIMTLSSGLFTRYNRLSAD